ncbi:MAG TPA: IniB N-terminal domain-containing protein [Pseudonocardia sp.]
MAVSTSLLDWLLDLLRDPEARAAFQADPEGYLNQCGFNDVSSGDVHDALSLISDSDHSHSDHGVHYPPPHHSGGGEDAAHYLNNYITNNYTVIDQHDTNIDNSVHQNIDTHGGDFDQTIDNDPVVASGDGAVAAGGDIRDSTVTTGDRNVVGDDNHAVTGDDNTTAFGSGNATDADLSHTRFGDGSGVSLNGDAHGHNTDNDTTTAVHNSGSGSTSVNAAGAQGYADQHSDQHESDSSTHSNYEDDSRSDSHDDVNSHNHGSFEDSHDTTVHHG